jgi:excinuclease ABC subunit C
MKDIEAKLLELREVTSNLTKEPGVYLMKNAADVIIYVGKAKNLRNRVKSYFLSSKDMPTKVKHMVRQVDRFDYIVTQTEVEAFLLEASLIKKHRPKYNIRLKDDKSYPYIKCSLTDPFPRFYLARKVKADKSYYYGPYTNSLAVRITMQFLNQTFMIRDCSNGFMKTRKRPCLTYDMGRCSAPCVNLIDEKKYGVAIKKSLAFLEGQQEKTVKVLESQMFDFAKNENFEVAAKIRDQIKSIQSILEKQTVVSQDQMDVDLMTMFTEATGSLVEIVSVRKGRVIGSRPYFFNKNNMGAEYEDERHWFVSFLNHYYDDNYVPDRIVIPIDLGRELLTLFLKVLESRTQRKVSLDHVPHEKEKALVLLGEKNAKIHFEKQALITAKKDEGLKLIQEKFKLPEFPRRIECFDISNFQGYESVASQVVFFDGLPSAEDYRKYKIKTVIGPNDFESMKEVLSRRFAHKELPDPQLIVVDGGKGQLKMACEALAEVGRSDIPVVGIAKSRTESSFEKAEVEATQERFFLPGRQNPVIFRENTEAFRILVSLRDEAHRFAIEFHRKLRDKESLASILDHIPGLGPKKREALDNAFPTIEHLKQASLEDILNTPLMDKKLAETLYQIFHP